MSEQICHSKVDSTNASEHMMQSKILRAHYHPFPPQKTNVLKQDVQTKNVFDTLPEQFCRSLFLRTDVREQMFLQIVYGRQCMVDVS